MKFLRNKQYLLRGVSGLGKTTSMNLLLDYYKPSSGIVKINDIPVNEIRNLNQLVTVMRQDAVLFEESLTNNITMYQDLPMDGKQDYDVLGYIYEFFIGNFAANAGKRQGSSILP